MRTIARRVVLEGADDASELDSGVGARHPPVGSGLLHGLQGLLVVAENADVYARNAGDNGISRRGFFGQSVCHCRFHFRLAVAFRAALTWRPRRPWRFRL